MQDPTNLRFREISLDVDWRPGGGVPVPSLPSVPGLYAEIDWETKGVRIGETGISIRGKIRHDIAWFDAMHNGTAPPEQLRRTLPIAIAAKKHRAAGFEFYVVSTDPRCCDETIRQDAERFLFDWVGKRASHVNWNLQR